MTYKPFYRRTLKYSVAEQCEHLCQYLCRISVHVLPDFVHLHFREPFDFYASGLLTFWKTVDQRNKASQGPTLPSF
jgi:hypothetical protein